MQKEFNNSGPVPQISYKIDANAGKKQQTK